MTPRLLVPPLVALALAAAACSGGPSVSTTTSTSSPSATSGAAASPGAGTRRGGLAGTVSSFNGTDLVLATRQGGSATVMTSASTTVSKSVTATVGDIAANDTVVVTGPVNPDGSYAASAIVVGGLGGGGLGAGGLGGNRTGTPSPRPSGAGGFGGRRSGTAGTVTAVKGGILTLTTAQGSTVTVVTSGSTLVSKAVAGALSDLSPNLTVTVTGPQNADGTYTATRIVIGGAGLGGGFGGGGAAGTPATGA
jgi:hypothetical protein